MKTLGCTSYQHVCASWRTSLLQGKRGSPNNQALKPKHAQLHVPLICSSI